MDCVWQAAYFLTKIFNRHLKGPPDMTTIRNMSNLELEIKEISPDEIGEQAEKYAGFLAMYGAKTHRIRAFGMGNELAQDIFPPSLPRQRKLQIN